MPFGHAPYGLSSLGIPLVGPGDISIPNRNGLVWFVDTTNGSDGNQGLDPTQPLKTIAQAILKAGNGTGDTIYVFPGTYAEALIVNKDYLAIIGATLAGYAKPDIGGGLALTVSAQGFLSRHCRYFGVADDTIVQEGNGFLYSDCVFDGDATADKGVRLVGNALDDALSASEGRIQNCLFRGYASGALIFDSAAITGAGVGSTDNDILNNRFYGNTEDIVTAATGAGAVYSVKTVRILGNSFEDKNKTVYIDITTNADGAAANQTGVIDGNYFAADAITTTNVKMQGTGFTFSGNLDTVGVVDGSALD